MKKIFLIFLLSVISVVAVQAKNDKGDGVYILGASINLKDSVVYFTEIQKLDGVKLDKSGFLPQRQFYAYELKDFMNFSENMPGRTSVIFFSKKRSKLEKKEAKIKERLTKREGKTVRYIGDRFKFTKP